MKLLDVTNPFQTGTPEYLAYQRAFSLSVAYSRVDDNAMYGRLLGYMLQQLPWESGRSKLAAEVNSCIDERSLIELATFYIHHFLCGCE
jgi:hypothetical protein